MSITSTTEIDVHNNKKLSRCFMLSTYNGSSSRMLAEPSEILDIVFSLLSEKFSF